MLTLSNKQSGLTLVETLLGISVAMFMAISMAKMQAVAVGDNKAKNAAEATQAFTQMAAQYLMANRAAVVQAMTDGTAANQWCVLDAAPTTGVGGTTANNTTLHTCAVDVPWLQWNKVVPLSFKATNPYNQKMVAVFRLIYADYDNNAITPDTTNGDVEMLTVGAANGGNEVSASAVELGLSSELMGGNGGFIPAADWGACKYVTAGTKEACGTGGGWRSPLGSFVNTP